MEPLPSKTAGLRIKVYIAQAGRFMIKILTPVLLPLLLTTVTTSYSSTALWLLNYHALYASKAVRNTKYPLWFQWIENSKTMPTALYSSIS